MTTNSDPRVMRKYRVFLGIPLHGALAEHDKAQLVTVNGEQIPVLPLTAPVYITLGYKPEKAMRHNRDSAFALKDALDRARVKYFRENPEDEGMRLELVDAQFMKTWIVENTIPEGQR